MNKDLLNILSNMQHADNQKLVDYLQGNLSAEDKHEVEKILIDSNFESEALEGLQDAGSREKMNAVVAQLNHQLQSHLKERRKHRRKRPVSVQQWIIIAIVTLLALAVLGYFVIYRFQHP